MKTVHKYILPVFDVVKVTMPIGAKCLSVANQNEKLVLYALVDTENPTAIHRFRVSGTGHPIDEKLKHIEYIGTALFQHGSLVLHVFDLE